MHPSGCKHGSRKPLADARICRLSIAGVGRSGSPAGDRDARTLRRFAREVRHRRPSPIGARIWFALSGILAALAGGYTAGRLAGAPKESTAGWRGLTTWALTTLVIYEVCGISLGKVRARDQRVRFKARLFHSVVLPSGVFSRARGIAISTWPKVPNSDRDRWP